MRSFIRSEIPRDFDPRLVKILRDVGDYLGQVDKGFAHIQRGEVPVSGGSMLPLAGVTSHHKLLDLANFDDHPQYAYLPGRVGGQELFGTALSSSPAAGWAALGNFTAETRRNSESTWSSIHIDNSAAVGEIIVLVLVTDLGCTHTSLTDSKGNAWTLRREYEDSHFAGTRGTHTSIWTTAVTGALTAGSDTLTAALSASIDAKAINSYRFSGPSGAVLSVASTATDRSDENTDPGSQSISGLSSGEYLFVRATGIEDDNTSYTPTAGHTSANDNGSSAIPSATTSGGASNTNVKAGFEFRILTGTGDTTDPSVNISNFPNCGSMMIALKLSVSVTGSLLLQAINQTNAAAVLLSDQTIRLSGAGDTSGRMVRFDNVSGGLLSYIRASDGAFIGPLTSTSLHSSLGGLTIGDDHTQYLLLAGRTGGQVIGVGAPTGGNVADVDIVGRLLVGNVAHNYTTGRFIDMTAGLVNAVNLVYFKGDATALSGVASGTTGVFYITDNGLMGYSSGTCSLYTTWSNPQSQVPAGVSLTSKAIRGQNQTTVPASSPGLITSLAGVQGDVVGPANAMSGTGTNLVALVGSISVGSNNTWTNLYGLLLETSGGTGTDTITNSYGIRVLNNWLASATVSGNHHGLYIDARSGGTISGTDYGIRILGSSAKSVIAGQLRLGSDAVATHLLELQAGTASVAPIRFGVGTNLTSAAQGCMEFDGTNLFITNGTPARRTLAQLETAQTWSASQTYSANPGIILNNAVGIRAKDSGGTTRSIIDPLSTDIIRFAALGASGWTFTNNAGTVGITVLPTGRIFIGGTTSPTHLLDLAAGTTTAAPIKLTSATAISTPVAGCLEFTTDDFFATITTGTARKAFILDDGTRLTSGRVPFATTNGRLTDSAALTSTNIATQVASLNLTNQGGAIGTTTLFSPAAAGYYIVHYTLEDTTADISAGTIQLQINFTDDVGATNQTGATLALTATGRDRGIFQVYRASGVISYATNLIGAIGAAKYALRLRLQYLG